MIGMSLSTRLSQRMELRQTLTPQQRQLVEMLEVPDASLTGYLEEIVAQNPALKRVVERGGGTQDQSRGSVRREEDERTPLEGRLAATEDLMEHLWDQFRLERTTDEEVRAAIHIMGNLDRRGILGMSLEEVAEVAEVDVSDAEDAQWLVMRMEPEGCGASSLTEYFVFMVKKLWPEDPFFVDIVSNHLSQLQKKRFRAIAKAMDLDPEDVEEYHSMLSEIDPWPARGFAEIEESNYVQPCMEVFFDDETNRWAVRMFDDAKVHVRVDKKFEAKVEAIEDAVERKAAKRQLEEARAVILNLEQRHSLVKQVAEIAVRHQAAFFERGPEELKNLTMVSVGEVVRRDTSTISRAVMGRYFRWEKGVMALRDLFVNRGGGVEASEAKLHRALRVVIEGENKKKPLSDDAIAKALKEQGFKISRRTVTKHRERIGIPSSRERRER